MTTCIAGFRWILSRILYWPRSSCPPWTGDIWPGTWVPLYSVDQCPKLCQHAEFKWALKKYHYHTGSPINKNVQASFLSRVAVPKLVLKSNLYFFNIKSWTVIVPKPWLFVANNFKKHESLKYKKAYW